MTRDTIVVGAGLNGLAAGALLARAGRSVLVLERSAVAGGLAAPREFHPGFTVPGLLDGETRIAARLTERLALDVALRPARAARLVVEPDGPGLLLDPDPQRAREELAVRSAADAEAYAAWRGFLDRIAPVARRLFDEPAPPLPTAGSGPPWSLARTAWGIRRLGRADLTELLRAAPMAAADWLGERFETELLRAGLALAAQTGVHTGPWAPASAGLLLLAETSAAPAPVGGAAALAAALERALHAQGGELRTEAEVARLKLADGRVAGVELSGGAELDAHTVLLSMDPRRALLELLPPGSLPLSTDREVRTWRARGTTAFVHLALDRPLEWRGRDGQHPERVLVGPTLDDQERSTDAVKYRALPAQPALEVRAAGPGEPAWAPEGAAAVQVVVHGIGVDIEGGWTDERRGDLLQRTLERLETAAPGARDLVRAHEVLDPAAIAEHYGTTGGHIHHGEIGLDQVALRPGASLARYATPVSGLYLCGRGVHPGPWLLGGSGAGAAVAATASRG